MLHGTSKAREGDALYWGIVFFILAAAPLDLGSESLTLTTYYPSPLGIYTNLTTTGNTYIARDAGALGVGTAALANRGSVKAIGQVWAGDGATAGGAVMFGGTTDPVGSASAGGLSMYGRARVGDWGQWLTIGEPTGNNGGAVIQITNPAIMTGGSPGLTSAVTVRTVLDDGSGKMGVKQTLPITHDLDVAGTFHAWQYGLFGSYVHVQQTGCNQQSGSNSSCVGVAGCGAGCFATWTKGFWANGESDFPVPYGPFANLPGNPANPAIFSDPNNWPAAAARLQVQARMASGLYSGWADVGYNPIANIKFWCCPM